MLHHPCQESLHRGVVACHDKAREDIFVSSKTRSAHSCSESESWPSVGIPRFFHFVIHHFIISVLGTPSVAQARGDEEQAPR